MNNSLSHCTDIVNTVRDTILRHNLLKNGDAVLVALSGGADSVCLLDILCRLSAELGIKVAAAHLNHMIRGAEADRDEAYAAELCTRLGVPFYAERVNIPEISQHDGVSEELAGRNARYGFFKRICKEHGYTTIATAHNKNDRAETVLMRVMRGTGIDGLCGIKYKRDDGVIRPILDVLRCDIERYCSKNNLVYCTDSTNSNTDYTRNRVRCELIPFIEKSFNPSIIDSLCNLAENSAEDADFINGYSMRLYNRINSPMPKRKPTVIDIKSLLMVADSIQTRIIRIAAREVMGSEYKLERIHIEAVKALCEKETGALVQLPSGLIVSVKYGWLEFATAAEQMENSDNTEYCYPIEIGSNLPSDAPDITFEVVPSGYKKQKNQMLIDYDMLEGRNLTIRNRRMGDKMAFFKDGRTRKLKDYWIDKKVPRAQRNKIPLLCADGEVVAIIGDRVSENYKIKETTKRGLVITYDSKDEDR